MTAVKIFKTPKPSASLKVLLDQLGELRAQIGRGSSGPEKWVRTLRREVRSSTISSSTSIEGFTASPKDAASVLSGFTVPKLDEQSRMAVACYARAMAHVGAMAKDPRFEWNERTILDLHFDACAFQPDKDPGLFRTGPIGVTDGTGGVAFRGPDGKDVPELMTQVTQWLAQKKAGDHPAVRAAMIHLHLASVHPFRDGNGRIARILQSLVLALDGATTPEFGSIEDYLAGHTQDYYAALKAAQGGSYEPDRDATPWVEFCVNAHLEQAKTRILQLERAAARWSALENLADGNKWPDRLVIAMEQALTDATDRASYMAEADVSLATASTDFRRLLDSGMFVSQGRGRSTRYSASDQLRELADRALG